MLDTTGNLILSSNDSIGDTDKAYWQSFNNPTDTYLPDMKVLIGSAEIHAFTSWKSTSDPSPGNFTMGIDPRGAPQIVVWEQSRRRWRSGHWNGLIFSGVPSMAALTTYRYGFKTTRENDGKLYLTYNPSDPSELMKFQLTWNGFEEQKRSQQDVYVCDSTDSFGWTGLPSHLYMATVDAQKETQSFANSYPNFNVDKS
ncbi:hypothetical protein D5086_022160 [Populus alba]|uniref:Uncharacterized protein n=1 Tax=Populus alba TaxID=43335 RepID=A0ACC4BFM4_POPAL